MAQAPIIPPTPANTTLPWLTERPQIQQASASAFLANQFVKLTGTGTSARMTVIAYATSAEPIYGIAQRDALATTAEPYLTPTGDQQTVIAVNSTPVWMNTLAGGAVVGTGDAASLVPGSLYGIRAFSTTNYTNFQGVDGSSTLAGGQAKYLGQIYPGDAFTDTNCRALFQIVDAVIQ